MEIRPIPDGVRSALRSGSNLLTIPHCINELVGISKFCKLQVTLS